MFQATLYFKQRTECIISELLDDTDESVVIEVEEVQNDLVTFVLRAGEHADEFYDRLAATDHVREVVRLDDENLLVTKPSCGAYSAIYQNHGMLRRQNTVAGSQRVYHVLFFRREDLKRIVSDMREIGTVSLGRLEELGNRREELTERQRTVIVRALEAGYYEWPREVKSEELAAELGISRATLHEHLRKAERTLLSDALGVDDDPTESFAGATTSSTAPSSTSSSFSSSSTSS
jgi:predicted DNA binding protein